MTRRPEAGKLGCHQRLSGKLFAAIAIRNQHPPPG